MNTIKMNTIKPPEVIIVDNDVDSVSCDGGNGALGHPVVWYSFAGGDCVECGYCDRAFVKKRARARYRHLESRSA